MITVRLTAALATAALLLGGCGGDDDSATPSSADASTTTAEYRPEIDPAAFVDTVDNPYMPLEPGTTQVYEGESGGVVERVEVTVTDDTKQVMGVQCVVVRDTVTVDGEVLEDTYDWFAQDRDGNVWYMGEDTKEYENGEVVSTEGTWEAGVDGAQPGIVMPADPRVGDSYRQEYYAGEAEDMAEVVRVGQTVEVSAGSYDDVVVTREWTPLEPGVAEEKHYAPGVGVVFEEKVEGGSGTLELVE